MSIRQGGEFEVGAGPFKRQKTNDSGWGQDSAGFGNSVDQNADEAEEPKMFQEYIILEREGPIDEVLVHYADVASLR